MASADSKAPPALTKDTNYSNWRKEIEIWSAFTSLKPEQKGPALFFRLEKDEARDTIREVPLTQLQNDGIKTILGILDKMYLKDECTQAYEYYETFEKFKRPANMNINDYVLKFESLYHQAKSHKMEILDGVLAYRLLNNANLSHEEMQLVKATITEMTYENMKQKLKMVFTNSKTEKNVEFKDGIKMEFDSSAPSYYAEDGYENKMFDSEGRGNTYYVSRGSFRERGRGTRGTRNRRNSFDGSHGFHRGNSFDSRPKPKENPLDPEGNISKCITCESKFHWANRCPDKNAI